MFLDNELAPQWNHEEDADPPAEERQREDARVLQVKAKEDQRGQREDDAAGNALACVPCRLDDVVLQNRRPSQHPQDRDRQHRDRNRRRYRQPGAKANIDRDRAKQDAKQCANQDGAHCQLWSCLPGGNERAKVGLGGCAYGGQCGSPLVSSGDECTKAFKGIRTHLLRSPHTVGNRRADMQQPRIFRRQRPSYRYARFVWRNQLNDASLACSCIRSHSGLLRGSVWRVGPGAGSTECHHRRRSTLTAECPRQHIPARPRRCHWPRRAARRGNAGHGNGCQRGHGNAEDRLRRDMDSDQHG